MLTIVSEDWVVMSGKVSWPTVGPVIERALESLHLLSGINKTIASAVFINLLEQWTILKILLTMTDEKIDLKYNSRIIIHDQR